MAIGTTLRSTRVQRGLSIEQVAQETRISARFLEALEDEAFDELPAPVYARGFLRSYANYLKIDAGPLLEQLQAGGRPVPGPDGFVGGPRTQQRPQRGGPDPFQRTPAPPPPVPTPGAQFDDEAESWDPEDSRNANEARRPLSGRFYENEPAVEPWPAAGQPLHPRRVAGVLLEREEGPDDGQRGARLLAIAGGAVILVLGLLAAAALLTRDGGGGPNAALPASTATAASKPGTVIAVGSSTASTTASPSSSANASPTGAPGTTTPAATGTPATATATPRPGTPTATATATATSEPPTATPVPATATPTSPLPTATPTVFIASHGVGFSECTRLANGDTDCGPRPFRVVCYPGGWFLDMGKDFAAPPLDGWRETSVDSSTYGSVIKVGESGC